jgi:hypothetical protein
MFSWFVTCFEKSRNAVTKFNRYRLLINWWCVHCRSLSRWRVPIRSWLTNDQVTWYLSDFDFIMIRWLDVQRTSSRFFAHSPHAIPHPNVRVWFVKSYEFWCNCTLCLLKKHLHDSDTLPPIWHGSWERALNCAVLDGAFTVTWRWISRRWFGLLSNSNNLLRRHCHKVWRTRRTNNAWTHNCRLVWW